MASNYEVNIKLNTRTVNKQLNNLEKRISKLNKLAQGGRANRTVNKREKERLNEATKVTLQEQKTLRVKQKQLKTDQQQLKVLKQSANVTTKKASGGAGKTTGGGGSRGGGKGGGVLSSALISGSFPLLFGQGLPGAVAGGLGGGIGAAVGGQMGGFAGGLVATSLLTIFQGTAEKLNTLGAALDDPSKNIEVLIERIKFFDKTVGTTISTLQSAGLNRTAADLARITLENRVGPEQIEPIKVLNKEMDKFGMLARDLGMKINSVVAGPLTGLFKFMNLMLGGRNNTTKADSDKTVKQSITDSLNKFDELKPELATARAELKVKNELFNTNEKILSSARERINAGESTFKVSQDIEKIHGRDLKAIQLQNDLLRTQKKDARETVKVLEKKIGNAERLVEIFKLEQQILEAQGNELRDQIRLQQKQSSVIRGDASEKDLAIKRKEVEVNKINRKLDIERAELKVIERDGNEREKQVQLEKIKNLELEKNLVIAIGNERINAADPAISRMDELNRKMRDLNDTTLQAVILSKAMGASFEDSFKGIIKGTMTVADAFRNMLNKIADYFLDAAAQMVATQFQKGIVGLFSNLFNFSTTPLNDIQGTVGLAANGGPVGMRKPYIVGERGPELFVPNQSGNIIPNHDLAGVGGGGTNIVVNVDASGSSVEGDEDEGRALGIALSSAIETELIKQKRPGGLLA